MRRVFIIRKDLNLSPGKLAAMVGHCAEAYWTNLLKKASVDNTANVVDKPYKTLELKLDIPFNVWTEYALGTFTKTICEAKNLNHLLKVRDYIDEFNAEAPCGKDQLLKEGIDYGFINDMCLTELKPENADGSTTVGVWFAPKPDWIAFRFSKKYKLYGVFDKEKSSNENQNAG